MHVSQSTQRGLQHVPVQASAGAGPPLISSWGQARAKQQERCLADSAPQHNPAQAPAGWRFGSPGGQAGPGEPHNSLAHPVPQHAPAQACSDCGAQPRGAWRHTAALQQEPIGAHSPASSSAPWPGGSAERQGPQAATPVSAVAACNMPTHRQPQKGKRKQETDTCLPVVSSSPSSIPQRQLEHVECSRNAAILNGQGSADEAIMGGEELDLCGELPDRARRAAALHSALIRHTAAVQLAAELESLFRLLGVPPAARAEAGKPSLLPSGRSAAQYACCVLSTTGMRWPLAWSCPGKASLPG